MKRGKHPKTVAAPAHIARALEARFQEGKKHEFAKDFATAEKIYREIVATYERHGYNPATPNAALGYVLLNQQKFEAAEETLRKSARQNPDLLEAHVNLAALYVKVSAWDKAIAASKRALEINPKDVSTLVNLGNAQRQTMQYALAVQSFLLALSLDGNNLDACNGIGTAYVHLGEPSVSIPMFRKILDQSPNSWRLLSQLFWAMQYDPTLSIQEVFEEHAAYGKKVREKVGPPKSSFNNERTANRRLRIGYISSDFKYHVVMRFVEHVLSAHDRLKFEITLIMCDAKQDKDTERIRRQADHWLDISEMSEESAAEAIWARELDLVIDLSGHSSGHRQPLLARRLAPVQLTWCGYSGTTGVDTMDYIIVDNVIAPAEERGYFTEQPLRLPHSFLCFRPTNDRETADLPFHKNRHITFGCLNNPSKINQYVISWWADILKRVPESKLLLRYHFYVDPLVRERVAKMLRECGVTSNRYEIGPGGKDFLSTYNEIDIALDTFPYNGTTTTCESLWMGVPVVTLRGDRFVARVGASLLTYTGLKDLVANTPEQYVQIASALAQQPEQMANLRHNLRAHVKTTPVFDSQTFTRNLEKAYEQVFQAWCEQPLTVSPAA